MDKVGVAVTEQGKIVIVPEGAVVSNGGKDLPLELPPGAYLVATVTGGMPQSGQLPRE